MVRWPFDRNYNRQVFIMANATDSYNNEKPSHCTLAVMRALTRPLIFPTTLDEGDDQLLDALLSHWDVRIPVDPNDYSTRHHWEKQTRTALFDRMFDWDSTAASTASLHPYFSFGDPSSPFFSPWADVGNCLRHLLLHRIASRQSGDCLVLASNDIDLFIATGPDFGDASLERIRQNMQSRVECGRYYLLRCHFNQTQKSMTFGYHSLPDDKCTFSIFHSLHVISLLDNEDWRLQSCIIVKNLARILVCLQHFAVPLLWSATEKRSLVGYNSNDECCVEKVYTTPIICNIFQATVRNMIDMYKALETAQVPHTDRLVSTVNLGGSDDMGLICRFAPVGRSYLPQDINELLDSLLCVCEALVALHARGIMHRDIRWDNIFHSFESNNSASSQYVFSREWVLFDFEFAAWAPQPAFGENTLTPSNHAPEMMRQHNATRDECHDVAVDIWGLGYLMETAHVDIPASHCPAMQELQEKCSDANHENRPTAAQCLGILQKLQEKPRSPDKDVMCYSGSGCSIPS
jgi:Protein kinase domain